LDLAAHAGGQALAVRGADQPGRVFGALGASDGRKSQVGVAVDETGHYHPAGGIDLFRAARLRQILNTARGPYLNQNPVAHQERTVLDNR
jgi:hypothetical protein